MPETNLLDKIQKEKLNRANQSIDGGPQIGIMDIAQERERRRNLTPPTIVDEAIGAAKHVGGQALEKVIQAGEAVDSVTGAPTRAAVGALQQAENPITAFSEQFAEDPSLAPTGKELAQEAGATEASLSGLFPNLFTEDKNEAKDWLKFEKGGGADITASGFAGLGLDVILDPTTLFGGAAVKVAKKGTQAARKLNKIKNVVDTGKPSILTSIKKGVKVTGEDIKKVVDKATNPRQSKEYERLLEIADKHKITAKELPEAVEFGKASFPSRFERFKAEGSLGEETLKKFENAFGKIDNALEEQIGRISGVPPSGNSIAAGELLKDGYDEAFDKLMKHNDITYGNIHKIDPGITLSDNAVDAISSKVKGIDKWATGQIRRGIQGEGLGEAKQMKTVLNALNNTNGSIKQTVEVMKNIGEIAFKKRKINDVVPRNVKKLRELYFTLSESVVKTVDDKLGKELATSLTDNNKLMSKFFNDRKYIELIGSDKAPETIFKQLVMNGDSKQIASLKKVLSPEKLQQIKGEYLASLATRLKDGSINISSFSKNLMKKEGPLSLFTKDEIKELVDIVDLHASMGEVVLSRSGTGGSNRFKDFLLAPLETVRQSATGESISETFKARARNFPERQAAKASKKVAGQTKRKKALEALKSDRVKKSVGRTAKGARLMSSQGETKRERALKKGK
jgi:hypothetical protein